MQATHSHLALFQGKHIRRIIYHNEWWFSIIDVISALSNSSIPKRYWSDLKIKLHQEGYTQVYDKIVRLKLEAPNKYALLQNKTNCAIVTIKLIEKR